MAKRTASRTRRARRNHWTNDSELVTGFAVLAGLAVVGAWLALVAFA
jgi:hypothetical protein